MGALIMLAQLVQSLFVSTSTRLWPSGTWANRPTNGNGGVYLATDIGGGALFRDNGTRWVPVSACLTLGEQNTSVSIGATTAETVLYSVVIPADLLGPNDSIEAHIYTAFTANTNNKFFKCRVDDMLSNIITQRAENVAAGASSYFIFGFSNRNSTASQVGKGSGATSGSSSVIQTLALNFSSAARTLYFTGQKANAADSVSIESISVRLIRGTS